MKNQVPWEMLEPPNDPPATVSRSVLYRPPLHESLIVGWVAFAVGAFLVLLLPLVAVVLLSASSLLGLGALLLGRPWAWALFCANLLVVVVISASFNVAFLVVLRELNKIF